jgi:hypothetical protein
MKAEIQSVVLKISPSSHLFMCRKSYGIWVPRYYAIISTFMILQIFSNELIKQNSTNTIYCMVLKSLEHLWK